MRHLILMTALLALTTGATTRAASAGAKPGETPVFSVTAPADAAPAGNRTAFSLAESWLAENVPQCPPNLAPEVAAKFVEQLSLRYPGEAERLARADVPLAKFESLLWQMTAARLSGPAYEPARQAFALRRVQIVRQAQAGEADPARIATAISRLQQDAPAAYRRLAEGRMEDEEVLRLPGLGAAKEAPRPVQPVAQARTWSAAEIVGEFARRNQVGAAVLRLRAYRAEALLTAPGSPDVEFLIFRLRPNLFRIHLRVADKDASIAAFDGRRYWRQVSGRAELIPREAAGNLRHLDEFLDLLLEPGDTRFNRLEDGVVAGRKCYRLEVKRADDSAYVVALDQENFQELMREDGDGRRTRYGDFREVAGITMAHREEATGPDGRTSVLVIRQFLPNPGLVETFFMPPADGQFDLISLEALLAPAGGTAAGEAAP